MAAVGLLTTNEDVRHRAGWVENALTGAETKDPILSEDGLGDALIYRAADVLRINAG